MNPKLTSQLVRGEGPKLGPSKATLCRELFMQDHPVKSQAVASTPTKGFNEYDLVIRTAGISHWGWAAGCKGVPSSWMGSN